MIKRTSPKYCANQKEFSLIKSKPGKVQKSAKRDVELTVTEPCGLLDFLLLRLSNRSRNHVKSLLAHREVLVDGTVVTRYNHPLHKGQKICINQSAAREPKQKNVLDILYEDSEIIVINKPAGLLSVATDQEKQLTAYHMITEYVRRSDPRNRVFIVHRLDRDTSGVLLFAKSEKIKQDLQNNWSDLVLERCYAAIVEGTLNETSGRIRSWLKETKTHVVYSSHKAGDGLEAITNYEVTSQIAEYSLLDIHLETGRKNQIRVHMNDIGHPVTGDKKYGAKTDPLKRLGLHAYRLKLKRPDSNQVMCFETQLPKSFISLFKNPVP